MLCHDSSISQPSLLCWIKYPVWIALSHLPKIMQIKGWETSTHSSQASIDTASSLSVQIILCWHGGGHFQSISTFTSNFIALAIQSNHHSWWREWWDSGWNTRLSNQCQLHCASDAWYALIFLDHMILWIYPRWCGNNEWCLNFAILAWQVFKQYVGHGISCLFQFKPASSPAQVKHQFCTLPSNYDWFGTWNTLFCHWSYWFFFSEAMRQIW